MRWVIAVALVLSSCNGCGGGETAAEGEGTTGESAGGGTGSGEGSEQPGEGAPPQPGARPEIVVRGEPTPDGHVAIVVESHGADPARLATELVIERRSDGDRWAPVEGIGKVTLRDDCEREAPECVTLVRGAELRPPPWLGTRGDAQCACERCVAAPDGTYRFVVRSCGGAHRIEGEPFELTRE